MEPLGAAVVAAVYIVVFGALVVIHGSSIPPSPL